MGSSWNLLLDDLTFLVALVVEVDLDVIFVRQFV